ncbi:MAG TPA: nucleotide-binding protein, partial [Propionibacterium sp.]|nr:nucleotide-binding protein [Propionibacterium sp.]
IEMESNGEERVKAVLDVFQSKLIKRGISLKSLDAGEPRLSGKAWKITASMQSGISQENAKKIAKMIRDEGPKGVKTQIQGDELRISSKKRDDLQAVQKMIREADYDFAVQFTNYR